MNITTIAWLCEDGSANNIWKMKRIYEEKVDKEEYPDFLTWLYDMERSAAYVCHDFEDKFRPFVADENDFCPVCGSHQVFEYENEQDSIDNEIYREMFCDDCGSTFTETYEYKSTMLTRIGG